MDRYHADGSLRQTNEQHLALKAARAVEGIAAAADYEQDAQAAIDRMAGLRAARLAQEAPPMLKNSSKKKGPKQGAC
jgi:hypothetical protein